MYLNTVFKYMVSKVIKYIFIYKNVLKYICI